MVALAAASAVGPQLAALMLLDSRWLYEAQETQASLSVLSLCVLCCELVESREKRQSQKVLRLR